MNASNTKLSLSGKQQLADMKKDYPHVKFAENGRNIVCAYMDEGKHIRFAFSVASPDEQKFRRKVGQLLAMRRVLPDWDNEFAFLPVNEFFQMLGAIDIYNPT